jgi:hypothetical protein
MKLQYAGDGNSVGPIRISWLVWCCTPRLRGTLPPQCPILVGNLVIDGTAKQRNTKGTVPCSLEKKLLTFVDRGDCCEHFAGGASGAGK